MKNLVRLVMLFLVVGAVVGVVVQAAPQQDVTVSLVPSSSAPKVVGVGEAFDVVIHLEPSGIEPDSIDTYIDYDQNCLTVTGMTAGGFQDFDVSFDTPGEIHYSGGTFSPGSDPVDATTIHFEAGSNACTTALSFRYDASHDALVTYPIGNVADEEAIDGEVQVQVEPPTSISLEADASEIGGDGEVGLTATVDPTDWAGMVAFTTTAGTVAPLEAALDASGQATATLTLPCADAAGLSEVTVTADASGETDSVTLDVTHGDAVEVALSPADTTMQCGDPAVAYTLVATDACGIGWDATPDATFAIDAGAGAMSANEYDAGIVGTWTVTGTLGALSDNATLTVEHGDATSLAVGDVPDPMTAGDPVSPVVTATDSCGNEWDATADASFDVTGGDCTGGECTVTESGTQTMTVTVGDYDQDFTLNVDPDTDNPQWVEIAPEDATMKDNESQAFTLMAYDTYTNSWDVTGESTFEVSDPNGTVVDNVYTPTRETSIGTWDVTGTYETLSDTTSLTVEAGVFEVTLPPTDTIDGGTYEVEPEGPYEPGTTVTLTAIADYCYEFDGWEGDVPAGQEDDETLVFDISADMAITPTFAMITYDAVDVTVMATGLASGTVSLEPASGPYNCGTTITATATATAGYFAGWEGALTGDTSPDTFTLDESSGTSLTAHFQPYGIYLPLVVRNAE